MPGEYKREPNHVRTSTGRLHRFAEPSDTPSLMAAWTRDFHRDMGRCAYPLPLFLAESHRSFLAIHPFDDGNGRTARLLVNFALLRRRLPPIVIKTEDRDRYIAGLQSADLGQVVPLATFMLDNALWSLDLAIRAANGESIEAARDVDKEVALFVRQRSRRPTREARHRHSGQRVLSSRSVHHGRTGRTIGAACRRCSESDTRAAGSMPEQARMSGSTLFEKSELAENKGRVPGGPRFPSERRETDQCCDTRCGSPTTQGAGTRAST